MSPFGNSKLAALLETQIHLCAYSTQTCHLLCICVQDRYAGDRGKGLSEVSVVEEWGAEALHSRRTPCSVTSKEWLSGVLWVSKTSWKKKTGKLSSSTLENGTSIHLDATLVVHKDVPDLITNFFHIRQSVRSQTPPAHAKGLTSPQLYLLYL